MTNMATMPIYGKNLKKSFPEPIGQWPWNLVCSIVYASTTKVVQIMTLDWPWPILHQGQIWLHRLLYGRSEFFFWNYCSLRSQSRLKHSAKWVNEVEWVSKVNVILWTWPKVIQISKLNVWLWPVYSGERFRASWPSCFSSKQMYWSSQHMFSLRNKKSFLIITTVSTSANHIWNFGPSCSKYY